MYNYTSAKLDTYSLFVICYYEYHYCNAHKILIQYKKFMEWLQSPEMTIDLTQL